MALTKITWADKTALNPQPSIARENKCTNADLNEVKSVVNNGIDQIENITGKILWTNPNPTSNIDPQTITLSSNEYDMLEIFYIDYSDNGKMMSEKTIKGNDILLNSLFYFNNTMFMGERIIEYTNDTTLYVGNCRKIIEFGAISSPGTANNWLIPQYIIGYKTGLFN